MQSSYDYGNSVICFVMTPCEQHKCCCSASINQVERNYLKNPILQHNKSLKITVCDLFVLLGDIWSLKSKDEKQQSWKSAAVEASCYESAFIIIVFVYQNTSDFQFHSTVSYMSTSNNTGNAWEEESGLDNKNITERLSTVPLLLLTVKNVE